MGKRKKGWKSEEERAAWDAHVDETIRNLRELAEKGWAELRRRQGATEPGPMPTLEEILKARGGPA